jgi:hypothetical protein
VSLIVRDCKDSYTDFLHCRSTSAIITDADREKAKAGKELGNVAFKEKRYTEAVRLYTAAIGEFEVLLVVNASY